MMPLAGQLLVLAVVIVTVLSGGSRLTCDCFLKKISSRKIQIACGYEQSSEQTTSSGNLLSCSKEVDGSVPRGYEFVPNLGLYKLIRTSLRYQEALVRCQEDGATLAVPNSKAEALVIAEIIKRNPSVREAFVGINDLKKKGYFSSIQGVRMSSLGYNQWSPGQPDNGASKGEACVTINQQGLYNDNHCEWVFAFVCQRPLSPMPPSGYRYIPQLGFYKHYTTPDTYAGARQKCVDDGGHLAVLDTQDEADELVKYYDNNSDIRESYIGLNDIEREGDFMTETGKRLTSLQFANWYPGEPNNNKGENCVTFHVAGTINDVLCNIKNAYFCEIPLPSK